MGNLQEQFINSFIEKFDALEFEVKYTNVPRIFIKTNDVFYGDLYIRIDDKEIMIASKLTHCHFEISPSEIEVGVKKVLKFLDDIMEGNLLLLVRFKDQNPSASAYIQKRKICIQSDGNLSFTTDDFDACYWKNAHIYSWINRIY